VSSPADNFLRTLLHSQPIKEGKEYDSSVADKEQRVQLLLRSVPAGGDWIQSAVATTAPATLRSRPTTWGLRRDAASASIRRKRPLTVTGGIEETSTFPQPADDPNFNEVLMLSRAMDQMGETLYLTAQQESSDVGKLQKSIHSNIEVGGRWD